MKEEEAQFTSTVEEAAQSVKAKSRQRTKGPESGYGAAVAVPARADRPATVDALDRSHYVRALTALIRNRNTEVPLTIGIYGRWGSGKSSFMEQLRQQLSARHEVVDFNPWRYNETQHILIGLIRAIAGPLDRQMHVLNKIRFLFNRSFLSDFAKFQKRVSAASKKIGNWLTAVTGGFGIWNAVSKQESAKPTFSPVPAPPETGVIETVANWLPSGITKWFVEMGITAPMIRENLWVALFAIVGLVLLWKLVRTVRHPFATQFEAYLGGFGTSADEIRELTRDDLNKMSEIIGGYTSKNTGRHPPPIVILLDDLDRCPPDSIVEVLEAINLFLMNLPFITVFGLDSKVVTQAVAERYHFMLERDAGQRDREEYGRFFLEKIINIPFQLPMPQSFDSYIARLIRRGDLEEEKKENGPSKETRENIPFGFAFEALKRRNDLVGIFLFSLFLWRARFPFFLLPDESPFHYRIRP